MNSFTWPTLLFAAAMYLMGVWGGCLYSKDKYNTKAVQSGCATRVLDTLSGDVKTVWKGEKE